MLLLEDVGGVVAELGGTPGQPLGREHQHDQAQEAQGELGRGGRAAQRVPGAVDAGDEGADLEVGDGAEIGQRLHDDEGQACGYRRPGQRQADAAEGFEGRAAQRAADLEGADRLLEEGGTGEHIDVRVEHGGEHEDRPAQRVHVGEPVVAPAPAGGGAYGGLDRAGDAQHVGVGIGQDIGRHRQRQHQRPVEEAPAREAVHGDEPGGTRPHAEREGGHAQAEQDGVAHILGQHRPGEMRPKPVRGLADEAQEGQQRGCHHQHEECGTQRPARRRPQPGCRPRGRRRVGQMAGRGERRDGHRGGGRRIREANRRERRRPPERFSLAAAAAA